MQHTTFDADLWLAKLRGTLDLQSLISEHGWANLLLCDSPISVLLIEHYRRTAIGKGFDLGPRVPIDRFVYGMGEPAARHLTKINGLPYRPKNAAWPRDRNGNLMAFVAQVCFVDSLDIVARLPGDVLLIFVRTKGEPTPFPTIAEIIGSSPGLVVSRDYPDSLAFEWYPLGLADLVTREDMPDLSIVFPTCYGVRNRSWDYVDDSRVVDVIRRFLPKEVAPTDGVDELLLRALAHEPGMKIGGVPIRQAHAPGEVEQRFIGSFPGVSFCWECPYPLIDRPEPFTLEESSTAEHMLNFYNDAWVNLSLNSDHMLDWDLVSWYNVKFGWDLG